MEEKTKPEQRTRFGKGSCKTAVQLAIPVVVTGVVACVDRIYIGRIPGIGAAALTGVGLLHQF